MKRPGGITLNLVAPRFHICRPPLTKTISSISCGVRSATCGRLRSASKAGITNETVGRFKPRGRWPRLRHQATPLMPNVCNGCHGRSHITPGRASFDQRFAGVAESACCRANQLGVAVKKAKYVIASSSSPRRFRRRPRDSLDGIIHHLHRECIEQLYGTSATSPPDNPSRPGDRPTAAPDSAPLR
jgi:hypothetical protein